MKQATQRLKQTFGDMYSVLIAGVVAFCIGLVFIASTWYSAYHTKSEYKGSGIYEYENLGS